MIASGTVRLPEPVRRYFDYALAPAQAPIARAVFQQTGMIRTGLDHRWVPFTAVERISTDPIAFKWDASVHLLGFVPLHVSDTYECGQGASEVKLHNFLALARSHDTPELAASSLVRFLAEAPWFPTALLPSEHLTWTALDRHVARATLRDGAVEVWADFAFGTLGEIVRVTAQRYRDVHGGRYELTPWTGHYRSYRPLHGMMIPMAATVAWMSGHTIEPVWRGRIHSAEYR